MLRNYIVVVLAQQVYLSCYGSCGLQLNHIIVKLERKLMMRFLTLAFALLTSISAADAQVYYQPTYQYAATPAYTQAYQPTYRYAAAPAYVVQPIAYQQPVAYQPATYTQPVGQQSYQGGYPDTPEGFLAALNAYRAQMGRGPVGWDNYLASRAATNNIAGHAPHSMAGGGQCWASGFSYLSALYRWIASPSHNAILLNATSAVGCSTCPSGMTLNTR